MCSGRGLNERLGAEKRCILSLGVEVFVLSTPFVAALVPLTDGGICVDAILLSTLVTPLVWPFGRVSAEGMMMVSDGNGTVRKLPLTWMENSQAESAHVWQKVD